MVIGHPLQHKVNMLTNSGLINFFLVFMIYPMIGIVILFSIADYIQDKTRGDVSSDDDYETPEPSERRQIYWVYLPNQNMPVKCFVTRSNSIYTEQAEVHKQFPFAKRYVRGGTE